MSTLILGEVKNDGNHQSISRVMAFNSIASDRQWLSASVSARLAVESVVCNGSAESSQMDQTSETIGKGAEKEFILTYRALPELWNTMDLRYTNKMIRIMALERLLPIYQKVKPYATIEDVRKKINSLRSNYKRELNKVIASEKAGGEVYRPKGWCYSYLNFLRKLEQANCNNETCTILEPTPEEEKQYQEEFKRQRIFIKRELGATTETFKIKRNNTSERKDQKYVAKPYQLRRCQISNPIALEWSETLDKLDPIQRLYAKKAINDILYEAELGNLHKNSVAINQSHSYYFPVSATQQSSPMQPTDPVADDNPNDNESSSDVEYKVPITEYICEN